MLSEKGIGAARRVNEDDSVLVVVASHSVTVSRCWTLGRLSARNASLVLFRQARLQQRFVPFSLTFGALMVSQPDVHSVVLCAELGCGVHTRHSWL